MSERRKASWMAWGLAIALLPLAYLLGAGPVALLYHHMDESTPEFLRTAAFLYLYPVHVSAMLGPRWYGELCANYFSLWIPI